MQDLETSNKDVNNDYYDIVVIQHSMCSAASATNMRRPGCFALSHVLLYKPGRVNTSGCCD